MAPRRPAAGGAALVFPWVCGAALAGCLLTSGFTLSEDAALSDEEIEQYISTPASSMEGTEQEKRYSRYTSTVAIPRDSRRVLLQQLEKELAATGNDGQKTSSMLQYTDVGSKLSLREESLLKAATPGYGVTAAGTREDDEDLDDLDHDEGEQTAFADLDDSESEFDDTEEEYDSDEDHDDNVFLEYFAGDDDDTEGQAGRPEKATLEGEEREPAATENNSDPVFYEENMHPASSEEEEDEDLGEQEEGGALMEEKEVGTPASTVKLTLEDPYANNVASAPSALQKSEIKKEEEGVEQRAREIDDEDSSDSEPEIIASFVELLPLQQSIRAHFRTTSSPEKAGRAVAAAAAKDHYSNNGDTYLYHRRAATRRPASFSEERNLELADQGPTENELLREAEGGKDIQEEESAYGGGPAGSDTSREEVDFARVGDGGEQESRVAEPPGEMKEEEVLPTVAPEQLHLAPPPEEAAGLGAGPGAVAPVGPEAGRSPEEMEGPERPPEQYAMPGAAVSGPATGLEGSLEREQPSVQPRARPPTHDEDTVLGPVGVGGNELPQAPGGGEYFPEDNLNLPGKKLREPAEDILRKTQMDTAYSEPHL